MITRTSQAEWRGPLAGGDGSVNLGSGAFEDRYCFNSGFEDGPGTNPEELLEAGHAACFSFPQIRVMWRDVAPRLARRHVVCADLRG